MKHLIPVPQLDILEWLEKNHPDLHRQVEIDRAWLWLPVDLRGDHNKETRESLKQFGFRFAKRGHQLPSGKIGTWSHAAEKPIPFKRKGGGKRDGARKSGDAQKTEEHPLDSQLAADIDRTLRELNLA